MSFVFFGLLLKDGHVILELGVELVLQLHERAEFTGLLVQRLAIRLQWQLIIKFETKIPIQIINAGGNLTTWRSQRVLGDPFQARPIPRGDGSQG